MEFYEGAAKAQLDKAGVVFEGGGKQVRFKDFYPSWIVETRKLK